MSPETSGRPAPHPTATAADPKALVDAVRRDAERQSPPPAKTGNQPISAAVAGFLDRGLGLSTGGSRLLTGLRDRDHRLTAAADAPRPRLDLPAGITPPTFAPATLVADTAADSLTVTSSAKDATLSVTIARASTTALGADDLTSRLAVTVPVLGRRVRLTGEIGPDGQASLSGPLPADAAPAAGTVLVAKGATVTLSTAKGLRVSGPALVGPTDHRLRVDVDGALSASGAWTLDVRRAADGSPIVPGLSLAPAVTGTITDDGTGDGVRFDLHAHTAGAWSPIDGVSLTGGTVEFANTPPQGDDLTAPGVAGGTPWLSVTGDIALSGGASGGTSGDLAAYGTVAVNLADGAAILTGRQKGDITLTTAPKGLSLGQTGFFGKLKVGRTGITGTIRGSGLVTAAGTARQAQGTGSSGGGGRTPVARARVTMTGRGGLVAALPVASAAPAAAREAVDTGTSTGASAESRAAVSTQPSTTEPSTTEPGTAEPGTAEPGTADASTTYTLSEGVRGFIADKLGIPIGSSPTVSGTLSGQLLTIQLGPPGRLPITLPAGVTAPEFGPTTLTVDESTGTLSLNAAAVSGVTATLQVTIAHADTSALTDGADLTATLALGDVPFVAGSKVALNGALAYTGGALSASLTGTLTSALPVTGGFVLLPGATLTLATGSGLTLSGGAQVGTGGDTFVVDVAGSFTNLNNWSLSVSDASAPAWQPLPSLTVVPAFSGSVTATAGVVGFDLVTSGDAPITWTPGEGATLSVTSLHVSNQAPPKDLACPSGIGEGDLWIDAQGSFSYTPASLDLRAEGCVNLSGKSFTIGTKATGELLPGDPTFALTGAGLSATGRVVGGAVSLTVTGHADLRVTGPTGGVTGISAAVAFGGDGLIAAATIGDLSALGSGLSGTGTVYVSSREVAAFKPADLGLPGAAFPATIPLERGVTLSYSGTLPGNVTDAFGTIGVHVPTTTVLAVATLSTTGISARLDLGFGAGSGGLRVFSGNGTAFYLNDVTVGFTLGANASVSLSGAGDLHLPPVAPGGRESDATVVVTGSLQLTPPSLTIGIRLSDWQSAFGVDGLSVGGLGGTVGVSPATVTVGFSADDVVLPASWGTAIGLVPGARTSLDVNLDLARPVIGFSIEGAPTGGSPGPALTPLSVGYANKIANGTLTQRERDVINSLVVDRASFYLAPFGGVTAANQTVKPGLTLAFDATVDHVPVKAMGAVGVTPPSLDVDVSTGAYPIGPVRMSDTHFFLSAAPTSLKLGFRGGIAYGSYSYQGSVNLAFGSTANGATVNLVLLAGLPYYLRVDGSFIGSVSGDGGDARIAAYGYGSFVAGGATYGTVSFGLNIPGSLSWTELLDPISGIAAFLLNHGVPTEQVLQIMRYLGYGIYDVLNTLGSIGHYGSWLLGQIAAYLPFNNNYYDIWTYTSSGQFLVLDVAGGSQSPNADVITYTWNGGYNQDWAFVESPGYRGWYEIVNRSSGQCLSVYNNDATAGEKLVQYPCYGGSNQLWYMGSVALNTTYYPSSLRSGLYMDVSGAYAWAGGGLDQWYWNGGRNQQFWLTNSA
ncbi:RICIN domain-containing protein [Microbispora sp. RL4-1S]|uniref:RICIN domain-containing protein n=1 Tax=Microbispora oryzae TaxID=2806554 RepID=A0A940WP09_9ACTN|nr:RICIN domain-containing protein [Microbispora oryzae]MBP2706912.1 RICIN domain-containing protein [Microbispora oryzae]